MRFWSRISILLNILPGNCETCYTASVIVQIVYFNTDALSLRAYRSGTKLENTSLSTDGKQGSAYEVYNLYNSVCRNQSFAITC